MGEKGLAGEGRADGRNWRVKEERLSQRVAQILENRID